MCAIIFPQVMNIIDEDREQILNACVEVFHGKGMNDEEIYYYVDNATDWSLSKKLVINQELIGFYLLEEASVVDVAENYKHEEDLSIYKQKRGINGIALVIMPAYRNTGYRNLLNNYPKTMGYDYIFGMQLKSLNNLDDWLKRRRLVASNEYIWITLEDF